MVEDRLTMLKRSIPLLIIVCAYAFQRAPTQAADSAGSVADAFATGWMLVDTNGDGIADFVNGKIVVPARPTAAENAAAANLAARLGFGTTGLTLPIVLNAAANASSGPRIWIGKDAVPAQLSAELAALAPKMDPEEGGVFALGGNLAIAASDDRGLAAAADAYAARAPYQWKIPGDKLEAIATAIGSGTQLVGVTYKRGTAGIYRAILRSQTPVTIAALSAAFASNRLTAVRRLTVLGGDSPVEILNPKTPPAEASAAAAPQAGGEPPAPKRLDLATLYTSRGLFNGTPRMPIPSSLDSRLYVPAGAAGTALANLAARMGMEATGITLPLASPAPEAALNDIHTQTVIAGESALSQEANAKLRAQDTASAQAETNLAPGEGEVRVVDDSFARHGALLARGDDAGAAAALDLLSCRFPNLWEPGKPYLSLEEIRYDLHRFFSLRSGAGQAAIGLYHLDRWMKEIDGAPVRNVKAELFVDLADPHLTDFVRGQIQDRLHPDGLEVVTNSLRAGTQCCEHEPSVHYQSPDQAFHASTPTFTEDLAIPWEGTRLLQAVRGVSSRIRHGGDVKLVAGVSEGPEQRRKLQTQLEDMLKHAGADPQRLKVVVLSAYKPGYSWLMDEIAPELASKPVTSIKIEFAKEVDPTGERVMYSPARWVQELYPVDEMLARKAQPAARQDQP